MPKNTGLPGEGRRTDEESKQEMEGSPFFSPFLFPPREPDTQGIKIRSPLAHYPFVFYQTPPDKKMMPGGNGKIKIHKYDTKYNRDHWF